MSNRKVKKSIIYLVVLLLTLGLTIGFSAFQNELFINDILLKVRLQRDVRVSESVISKSSGAVVNDQEYNKTKLLGNVTFDSTSSYVLYRVDLTNYGNVKSGLLNINSNTSGINYSICDSNGSNCTNDLETPICNGTNCTLGATKEVYVKVTSTTSGTKNIDLDLDIQPYVNVTYDNIRENTSSFKTEVLETSTYQLTLTSKPEEVEVSGDVTVSYNKTTGVLVLSNIQSDLTIHAKYLLTEVAHTSYTEAAPENYVRFNNSLFRIITKENIDDGYGNSEFRTKITSDSSIGNNVFDDESNEYGLSSLKDELNTTYYNSLNSISKELIDTAKWTNESVENIGLINTTDYNNSSWLRNDQYTLTKAENNKVVAVTSTGLVDSEINVSRSTFPTTYLKTNVLVVGGNGTESNPYILDLASNGLQPNPTVISRRTLTVTGSNQNLVTVSNKVGTPYYSVGTPLNSSNYNTSGSTAIPSRSDAGSYTIYYYIPAEGIYKAKSGSVTSIISPLTFTIAYQKGSNVSAIEKASDSCTTSGSSLTCDVKLPSITPNNGYESVGWSLTNGDTEGLGVESSYTLSANGVTLYANAVVKHNYQNTTTLAYYGTLNDAFASVSNNQTIKVLENVTETTNATLASGKTGVKLDLNGKIVTMNNAQITNNGTLDIYNTSSTTGEINSSDNQVIGNNGTLTLNGTSSTNKIMINKTSNNSSNGAIFNNNSKSLIVGDNVEVKTSAGSSPVIVNQGTTAITGGIITGSATGINNQSTGELNISGSGTQITGTSSSGIYNSGIATITGGSITGSFGIYNDSTGNLNISGSNTQISSDEHDAIFNNGVITVTEGNISGLNGIYNGGTLTISGGTISGERGFVSDGVAVVTGGVITGEEYGIVNRYTLTIGQNDSLVSTNSPVIQTNGTSNSYGLYHDTMEDTTFNFYDGVIKSASGSDHAISINPTNIPEGYKVQKTVTNGIESAILIAIDYKYINTTTNARYETLNEAFSAVENNQTIKVLENVTEDTTATLNKQATVKLDLNGKTISSSANPAIFVAAELDIYSSAGHGKIIGTGLKVINNEYGLTINSTSATNQVTIQSNATEDFSSAIFNERRAICTLNNNVNIVSNNDASQTTYAIENRSSLTINGANIINNIDAQGSEGIYNNDQESELYFNSGTIVSSGTAIENYDGYVTISGGSITGITAIWNTNTQSTVIITGGTLTADYGTVIDNYGTATITGGNLICNEGNIIDLYSNSTLTLGTNDSSVSTTSPLLINNDTNSSIYVGYGINNSSGVFNFYDGIIKASKGSNFAINSNPTDIPAGYRVKKELVSGVEEVTLELIPPSYINTTTNNTYVTLNEAFGEVQNNQTIKVIENAIETANSTLASDKTGIKLDLNGKVVDLSDNYLDNNGSLDIYNTSSTEGIIRGSGNKMIQNNGNLSFNGTSTANKITIGYYGDLSGGACVINNELKTFTMNSNTEITDKANMSDRFTNLVNYGIATITGGTISDMATGIQADLNSTLNISGNTSIEGGEVGILSNGADIVITDGLISGGANGISTFYNTSDYIEIIGGTITGGTNAIKLSDGTLVIGINDSSVSTISPVVQSIGTSGTSYSYGVYVNTSGTSAFNFYDGVIKSSSGSGYAINSVPADMPEGYEIKKEVVNGVESAYLERITYTATFYYNSNTTSGNVTVSTATTTCSPSTSGGSCTASVPSEVTSSVGKYNIAYGGVADDVNKLTSASLSISGNKNFYAFYNTDNNVTVYYPSSTTARSSTVYKRNEYFDSSTTMKTVLATTANTTSDYTFSSVSGYELYGFANNASTNTRNYSSVSALAQSDKTTSYAVLRVGKTATVYYNSGSGNGTLSVSTATTNTAYQYLRCTSTAAELSNSNYTIPTSVSGSVGQYGNTYYGTASAVNSMTNARTTAYTTLYAIYRNNNVTNYYYSSSYTNRTLYRNNMFTSTTAMKSVLSTSGTGTSNYSTATGPGSSVWTGLSTGQDTTTEYSSVANAAASTATTLYTVYTFNVTYQKGSNVSAIGSTSGSCKVTTSSTSCNVTLPSITPNSGYVAVGWNTTKDATTGTAAGSNYSLSTNAQTLYGNVKAGQFTITFNKNYNNLTNMPANGSSDSAGAQVIYSWTNNTGYTVTITEAGSDVDVCKSDWTAYYQPKVTLRVNNVDKVTIQEQSPDTGSNGHVSGLNISVSNGQTVTMYSYGYTAGGQSKTFWYGNSNQCFFKYKINDTGTTQKTYYTNDTTAIGKIFSNIDGHTISSYNTASGGGGTSFATTATPKQIFASQGSSPTLYAIWQ